MDVSPNALRKETLQTLNRVNKEIEELELRHDGSAPINVLAPLLLAKAQCLQTLTLLREQGRR